VQLPTFSKEDGLEGGTRQRGLPMRTDQLKPNVIVKGSLFPEEVQIIQAIPLEGDSVRIVGTVRMEAVSEDRALSLGTAAGA